MSGVVGYIDKIFTIRLSKKENPCMRLHRGSQKNGVGSPVATQDSPVTHTQRVHAEHALSEGERDCERGEDREELVSRLQQQGIR